MTIDKSKIKPIYEQLVNNDYNKLCEVLGCNSTRSENSRIKFAKIAKEYLCGLCEEIQTTDSETLHLLKISDKTEGQKEIIRLFYTTVFGKWDYFETKMKPKEIDDIVNNIFSQKKEFQVETAVYFIENLMVVNKTANLYDYAKRTFRILPLLPEEDYRELIQGVDESDLFIDLDARLQNVYVNTKINPEDKNLIYQLTKEFCEKKGKSDKTPFFIKILSRTDDIKQTAVTLSKIDNLDLFKIFCIKDKITTIFIKTTFSLCKSNFNFNIQIIRNCPLENPEEWAKRFEKLECEDNLKIPYLDATNNLTDTEMKTVFAATSTLNNEDEKKLFLNLMKSFSIDDIDLLYKAIKHIKSNYLSSLIDRVPQDYRKTALQLLISDEFIEKKQVHRDLLVFMTQIKIPENQHDKMKNILKNSISLIQLNPKTFFTDLDHNDIEKWNNQIEKFKKDHFFTALSDNNTQMLIQLATETDGLTPDNYELFQKNLIYFIEKFLEGEEFREDYIAFLKLINTFSIPDQNKKELEKTCLKSFITKYYDTKDHSEILKRSENIISKRDTSIYFIEKSTLKSIEKAKSIFSFLSYDKTGESYNRTNLQACISTLYEMIPTEAEGIVTLLKKKYTGNQATWVLAVLCKLPSEQIKEAASQITNLEFNSICPLYHKKDLNLGFIKTIIPLCTKDDAWNESIIQTIPVQNHEMYQRVLLPIKEETSKIKDALIGFIRDFPDLSEQKLVELRTYLQDRTVEISEPLLLLLKKQAHLPIEEWVLPDASSSSLKNPDHLRPSIESDPLTSKSLFTFVADPFGENSELEGASSETILSHVSSYLEKMPPNYWENSSEVIRQMKEAITLKTEEQIKTALTMAFKEKRSTLIPGGWVGKPIGHAIYYEIIPQADGKATMRLFNTGGGLQEHDLIQKGVKEKVIYGEWKDIPQEKFINESLFAKAVFEMNTYTENSGADTEYTPSDVYEGLKGLLGVTQEQITSEKEFLKAPLIQIQRSATCTFRSLLAFLKTKMTEAEYKRFKIDMQLQSLASTSFSPGKTPTNIRDYHLAVKARGYLARKVNILFEKNIIGIKYLSQALEVLQANARNTPSPYTESIETPIATDLKPIKSEHVTIQPEPIKVNTNTHIDTGTKLSHIIDETKDWSFDTENLTSLLENFVGKVNDSMEKGLYETAEFAIMQVVKKLPLEEEFWKKCSNEKNLDLLQNLSDRLFDSHYRNIAPYRIFTETKQTFFKLLYIQKLVLAQTQPSYSFCYTPGNIPLLGIHNEKTYQELDLITKQIGANGALLRMCYGCEAYGDLSISLFDSRLLRILKSKYPKIVESLRQNIPDFDKKHFSKQIEQIWFSDELPASIQKQRDQILRFKFIQNNQLGPITDPDKPVTIQHKTNEFQELVISLGNTDISKIPRRPNSPKYRDPVMHSIENTTVYSKKFDQEKTIITSDQKPTKSLSTELQKELLHIFSSERCYHIELIEFFYRHPDLIENPDLQQIFEQALFIMKRNKTFDSSISQPLIAFIEKQLTVAIEKNQLEVFVFLLHTNRYLSHFTDFKDKTLDGLSKLIKLVENQLTDEEKALVFHEISAHLSEKDTLTSDEIGLLLTGAALSNQFEIRSEWLHPETVWESKNALIKHSKAILEEIGRNSEMLNEICQYVYPNKEKYEWNLISNQGEHPIFKTENGDFFSPLEGKILIHESTTLLPEKIRLHPLFQKLFPSQNLGKIIGMDIYEFTDSFNHKVVIRFQNPNILTINQKRDDEWYTHIDHSKLVNGHRPTWMCSHDLAYAHTHWISNSNPSKMISVTPENDTVYSTLTLENGNVSTIINTENLRLGQPGKSFQLFEPNKFCEYWYTEDNQIAKVSLPRFSLSFTYNADKERLQSKEFPEFYLDKNQALSSTHLTKGYLLLTNEKGEKKLLLPDQKITVPGRQAVLIPKYEREQQTKELEKVRFNYFSYDIDSNAEFTASTREGYFHLIETLAAQQEYDKASLLLKKQGEKLTAYTEKEATRLMNIMKIGEITGDSSANQYAISLYAAMLLKNNPFDIDALLKKKGPIDQILASKYEKYLNHFQHLTTLKLPLNQEKRLLKNLIIARPSRPIFYRLRELDPEYAKRNEIQLESLTVRPSTPHYPDPFAIYWGATQPILEKQLVTRGKYAFQENSEYCINCALFGTDSEKRWLSAASHFLCADKEKEMQAFGWLLKDIFNNPERYKNVHDYSISSDIEEILEELQETNFTSSSSTLSKVDITPPSYHIGRLSPDLPEITPSFSFEGSPPLSNLVEQKGLQDRTLSEELKGFFQQQVDIEKDPQQLREWNRLNDDLTAYQDQPQEVVFQLSRTLKETKSALEESNKEWSTLHDDLLRVANSEPEDIEKRKIYQLQIIGGVISPITIDDLIISFARKEPRILQSLNPSLSEKDLSDLYTKIAKYLDLSIRKKQKESCLKTLSKIPPEGDEGLEAQLVSQLQVSRAYNPIDHPAYLAFEYYSGMILYKKNIDKLDDFLKGKDPNPIMEMIMGSGKSKVLLPILGLLKADGENLSMVIVPAPLFESISSDTQVILRDAFSKSLQTLHFDRNSTFTERSLEEIRDILKEIILNKECLIMTSKSIQCLLLKFIEHVHENENSSIEFTLMQEIIGLLSAFGTPLIDEADTVLNLLRQVSFSLGEKLSPSKEEQRVVNVLYTTLYTDPSLRSKVNLESDNPEAPPFTEKLYHDTLKKPLAEALINKLKEENTLPELQAYLTSLKDPSSLITYLCRDTKEPSELENFYKGLPDGVNELIALLGEQISHLLPHTLSHTAKEHFGVAGSIPYAIPFSAVDTPSLGSVFANHHITMNYTLQYYQQYGVDESLVLKQVQNLQQAVYDEIEASGGELEITDTAAYKTFKEICGDLSIPILQITDERLKALTAKINKNTSNKIDFITNLVLPQIEFFEKELSCNPIGLISLFNAVSGFTGTLWNTKSMHRKITPVSSKGTDAKTITLLWKMTKQENVVSMIPKGSTNEMLNNINVDFDLISDVGGYFKQGKNLDTARAMAIKYQKPCLYYDINGAQRLTNGTEEFDFNELKLEPEERNTFLDQSHTTGADTKQKQDAVGIVTIGKKILLRDLLQGVWRLRGLDKNQRIHFVVDEEVNAIIKKSLDVETVGFGEILKFAIKNQAEKQGTDNFKSFKSQVWAIPQYILISSLLNTEVDAEQQMKAFNLLIGTWVKEKVASPGKLYGVPASSQKTVDVLDSEAKKCKEYLKDIYEKLSLPDLEEAMGEIDKIKELFLDRVHPEISTSALHDADTVEVETQQQTETEIEIENLVALEERTPDLGTLDSYNSEKLETLPDTYLKDFTRKTPLLFPLINQFKREEELHEYADLFEGIHISFNILEFNKDENNLKNCKLFGTYRTPYHHLLVEGDDVSLLSLNEASWWRDYDHYNLYLGRRGDIKNPKPISDKAFGSIVKLKFLNGDSRYNAKEIQFLKSWAKEAGVERLQTLFETIILRNQHMKREGYANSVLKKMFNELRVDMYRS